MFLYGILAIFQLFAMKIFLINLQTYLNGSSYVAWDMEVWTLMVNNFYYSASTFAGNVADKPHRPLTVIHYTGTEPANKCSMKTTI